MANKPAPPLTQLGSSIAVATQTELGNLDPSLLTPGTSVYVTADASTWVLTVSTAGVGAGVIAVAGITGYRWIEQGGSSGFVTLAQLASTTVTSGGTLTGINNPAGRYDQASLQGILDQDAVMKVDLAASDGTGGTSIIATQNTGGYQGNTKALEPYLQGLGASIATLGATYQTIANPANFTLSNTHVLEADLTATSTNVIENLLTVKRASSGTPAVGMGVRTRYQLADSGGTTRDGYVEEVEWTGIGATTGSTVTKKTTYLQGLGSGTGLQTSMVQTGGGNGQAQFQDGNGSTKPGIAFISANNVGMGNSGGLLAFHYISPVVGMNASQIGFFSKQATPAAPGSVGAAATNSVAPTGSANVYPDFTNGTVYATDYASLHATISQMAAKLTAIESSLRAMGLIVT
jgi:hypothetical protein